MNKYYVSTVAVLLVLVGCSNTDVTVASQQAISKLEYICEQEKFLSVTYVFFDNKQNNAEVIYNNVTYSLVRVRSASGEKYSDGKHVWWVKGDSGFFEMDNATVLNGCSAIQAGKRMHPSWDLNNDSINDCESDGSCDHTVDYTKPRISKK